MFTPALSLSSYGKLLGTSVYAKVFANTFEISATVTLLALVLGYPLAFVLATAGPRTSRLMLGAIIVPLWTSVLVRTYAWMVLLGRRGLVNEGLQSLGLLDAPLPLLYNRLGVTIGMVHVLLPFMVLPIYSVMKGIDVDLLKARRTWRPTGARPSCRLSAAVSVRARDRLPPRFVSGSGNFVTPALLGGRGEMMDRHAHRQPDQPVLDWGLGSALAVVLFAITAGILLAVSGSRKRRAHAGARAVTDRARRAGAPARAASEFGPGHCAARPGGPAWPAGASSADRPCGGDARVPGGAPGGRDPDLVQRREVSGPSRPPGWSRSGVRALLRQPRVDERDGRSFEVAVLTTCAATAVGTAAALAGWPFRGRSLIRLIVLAPLVVPSSIMAIAIYGLYAQLKMVGTLHGLVLAGTPCWRCRSSS